MKSDVKTGDYIIFELDGRIEGGFVVGAFVDHIDVRVGCGFHAKRYNIGYDKLR